MNRETELVVGNCLIGKKVLIPSVGGPSLKCEELRQVNGSTVVQGETVTEGGEFVEFRCNERKCPFYERGCHPT